MNSVLWLLWATLLALTVSATRNPFYLGLALTAVLSVWVAVDATRPLGRAAPRFPLAAGFVLLAWSSAVNGLLAHIGDRVIVRLPPWPVVGGPVTLNAVVYGALTGLALATILIGVSLLHVVLDRRQALRLVPSDHRLLATTLAIALNALPTFAAAARDALDAIRVRGIEQQPFARLAAVLTAVLGRGMDYSLAVAETLEVRGFAARESSLGARVGTAALLGGALLAVGGTMGGSSTLVTLGFAALMLATTYAAVRSWPGLRTLPWPWPARVVLLCFGLAALGFVLSLRNPASDLAYSPYPTMRWPTFSPVSGTVYLALALPALVLAGRRE